MDAMHEWALAEGVIATALKVAEKEGFTRITKIVVAIGELQQIESEIFEYALKEVMPTLERRLESVDIILRTQPAVFRCRSCEHAFGFSEVHERLHESEAEAIHLIPELAHTYLGCPECGSPDFEVAEGRGVWIDALEGTGAT